MATNPTPITALPTPPLRSDPVNFSARADAFLGAFPALRNEINAISVVNYNNTLLAAEKATLSETKAAAASASAASAALSASEAAASVGATMWVSGTTYALGTVVWSPLTGGAYRRIVAGGGTTDPSNDFVNWASVFGAQKMNIVFYETAGATVDIPESLLGDNYLHVLQLDSSSNPVKFGSVVRLPFKPRNGAVFNFVATPAGNAFGWESIIYFNGGKFRGNFPSDDRIILDTPNAKGTLVSVGDPWGWV